MDVLQALRSLEGGEPFDCIFMDAPYEQHLEQPVLEYLADSTLADENMLVGFIFLGTYQMISKVLYIRKIRM